MIRKGPRTRDPKCYWRPVSQQRGWPPCRYITRCIILYVDTVNNTYFVNICKGWGVWNPPHSGETCTFHRKWTMAGPAAARRRLSRAVSANLQSTHRHKKEKGFVVDRKKIRISCSYQKKRYRHSSKCRQFNFNGVARIWNVFIGCSFRCFYFFN